MLRHTFGLEEAAKAIENAVHQAIILGHRTGDIFNSTETGARRVGTVEMGDVIALAIARA